MRFSQRKGFSEYRTELQIESISDSLRNSLWNVLDVRMWSVNKFKYSTAGIGSFSAYLWITYFKKPIDSRKEAFKEIRAYFFSCEWFEVYDFLEAVIRYRLTPSNIATDLNRVLELELAAYRIVEGLVVEVTDEQEVQMLEEAFADNQFDGVNAHLKRALELFSDRKNPDYRNSIKESISAVESMARLITNNPKATLGDALKELEKLGKLHSALKTGFSNLYGYTSDEQGIRHSMLNEPTLSAADAKYFLLSCTSFVNYLKSKL